MRSSSVPFAVLIRRSSSHSPLLLSSILKDRLFVLFISETTLDSHDAGMPNVQAQKFSELVFHLEASY